MTASRYVNVKTHKKTRGPCIMRDCSNSAHVTATRIRDGFRMVGQWCHQHAEEGRIGQ